MSRWISDTAPDRSAQFYDGIARNYDQQMGSPDDAWIRSAFWDFVDARVPRAGTILEFGCGTGVDAARYATRGHAVLAYDNAPEMIERLRLRCAGEVTEGRVDAWSAPYAEFRASLQRRPKVNAVTANFAAVNHLPDLEAWLETLGERLHPDGVVLVSSLNACPLSDLARLGFWRRAIGHRHERGIPFHGDAYDHVRYWPWRLGRGSKSFRVVSRGGVGALLPVDPTKATRDWASPRSLAERVERAAWDRWPGWLVGQFTFVELRKRS